MVMKRPQPIREPRTYLVDIGGRIYQRTREHVQPRTEGVTNPVPEKRIPTALLTLACVADVSNVCEAAPGYLFWASNGLNKLPKMRLEFPFILIGKSSMSLLTGHSCRVLKSWYTGGDPEQGFRRCFADGLNQMLVSPVAQAILTSPSPNATDKPVIRTYTQSQCHHSKSVPALP